MTDWGEDGLGKGGGGGKYELVSMFVCSLSTLFASCLAGKKKKEKKRKKGTAPATRRLELCLFIFNKRPVV